MNQQQADALIDAGMTGVRQLRNRGTDNAGGYCAAALLYVRGLLGELEKTEIAQCPECAATRYTDGGQPGVRLRNEMNLIVHLNNDHEWDFISIARKLGPKSDDVAA
jgi:hypothetical protein